MPRGYNWRVELRHLRYFVASARLGNLSRAARELRIAQPSLSRQIRDLEDEVGVPLLRRTPRGVEATEAGAEFARRAAEILKQAGDAVRSARAVANGEAGEVRLGFAPTPSAEILPRALHAFQNAAPSVRVTLQDASTAEMLRGLAAESMDAALCVRPMSLPAGAVFEMMTEYAIMAAVSPEHVLARARRVSPKRLLDERLVVFSRGEYEEYHLLLDAVFKSAGRVPPTALECDGGPALIAAVEAGRGVAIVPGVFRCLAGPRLRLVSISPPPSPLAVGFAWFPGKASPAVRKFVELLRQLRSSDSPSLRPPKAGRQ
jgi:LysR family transcriptional regulator, benzoate and cis,cis-muconate-responsive activator of ben and cat genes